MPERGAQDPSKACGTYESPTSATFDFDNFDADANDILTECEDVF